MNSESSFPLQRNNFLCQLSYQRLIFFVTSYFLLPTFCIVIICFKQLFMLSCQLVGRLVIYTCCDHTLFAAICVCGKFASFFMSGYAFLNYQPRMILKDHIHFQANSSRLFWMLTIRGCSWNAWSRKGEGENYPNPIIFKLPTLAWQFLYFAVWLCVYV